MIFVTILFSLVHSRAAMSSASHTAENRGTISPIVLTLFFFGILPHDDRPQPPQSRFRFCRGDRWGGAGLSD